MLIGFAYLFWQQSSSMSQLRSEIESQEQKISQLLQESSPPVNETTPKAPDDRILLTPETMEQYWTSENGCRERFNYDKPNTYITYQSESRGLSVEIPYNLSWGNETYRINPYDEVLDGIKFGNIGPLEACSWVRTDLISFKPALTVAETLAELSSKTLFITDIEKVVLTNGLTGFKYFESGLVEDTVIEVIGKKFNYKISIWPKTISQEEGFALAEKIANSIKLLD